MTKRVARKPKRTRSRGTLATYRKKRDFERTAEPAGLPLGRARGRAGAGGLFVIHKHAASRLHYDLRLEMGGALKSWAVPKGPSVKPGEKRLAVQVEDHPYAYKDFEGTIPKGQYGGGTVMIWDRGTWTPISEDPPRALESGKLEFRLEGEKLGGAWTLVRMGGRAGGDGKNWLLMKKRDPDSDRSSRLTDESVASGRTMAQISRGAATRAKSAKSAKKRRRSPPKIAARASADSDALSVALPAARRRPMPSDPRPQLATLARAVPDSPDFIHEIKFDGYRILARVAKGRVTLLSRNGKNWTSRFRRVASSIESLPAREALLDGEMVALGPDGISTFHGIQEALRLGKTDALVYQVFDLLHLNGWDLTPAPLLDRKRTLAALCDAAGWNRKGPVRYTDHIDGAGAEFWASACRLGLEGVVSKSKHAPYRMAARSPEWRKVKCSRHEDLVVGGYTDPGGSRTGFGALLLGAFDPLGNLHYAGKVGTGFDTRLLRSLSRDLRKIEVDRSPFADFRQSGRGNGIHWVRPEKVAEVEFTEWTSDGLLRHPSFRGLRDDKEPSEVLMSRIAKDAATARATPRAAAARLPKIVSATRVAGVPLTHPDRVLYPEQGLTKLDLARYYESVSDWILPLIEGRPLSLLRCPDGRDNACFFQKHPGRAMDESIPRIEIREKSGTHTYLYVKSLSDIVWLVQTGTLELHVWGSRIPDVERPDQLVFDLDPGPKVPWAEVIRVARVLREKLASLGFTGFPRTTGGRGLHVVVPLEPAALWDEAKSFAKSLCEDLERDDPRRLTTNMSKSKRIGRIFLDYLRNGRGSTAVASYSTRASAGATVAVPIQWKELVPALRSDHFTVENLPRRLQALKADPWKGFEAARRPLGDARPAARKRRR